MNKKLGRNILKNEKGVILILSLALMVFILGISGTLVMRAINTSKINQRNNSSLRAFYEAEAGIWFAYSEESLANFKWYTHQDRITPITDPTCQITGADIDDSTGCYRVTGRNFLVKAYPEQINGQYTGIIVIHSQATVNEVTRTIEYRLNQVNPYEYFFFFPQDTTFSSAIYDARNYGGIHVNGDIRFTGNPQFRFLTALTCGSTTPERGYIIRPLAAQYLNLSGEIQYSNSASSPQSLPYYMYTYSPSHFYTGTTTFKIGPVTSGTNKTLNYYLEGSDADWSYQKYAGTSTTPTHYIISNGNLKNLALYELTGHAGSVILWDNSKTINVSSIGSGSEGEIFQKLYNHPGESVGLWTSFWTQWKANHQNDYATSHTSGVLTGGSDWERRFFLAAYNWGGMSDGIPDGINREWWENLSYGNDRAGLVNTNMALAKVENYSTGLPEEKYFLNTKEQSSAWGEWLGVNQLNAEGDDKTLIQDRSQGGKYIDPGKIFGAMSSGSNVVKKRALNGGIYIGPVEQHGFQNPINDCTTVRQFYNANQPARSGGKYKPSNILEIDVHCLKGKIEEGELPNFNGVIYVDLNGYPWSSDDNKADGVMLVNAARLPDGGLSLGTPNNVFIKGNYNLDPTGDAAKNRTADDATVINRVKTKYGYSTDYLKWQPTEIITQRVVYTLSEDFPEPAYMPMCWNRDQQYYDESYSGQDFVSSDPNYPTDSWVPNASRGSSGSRLNNWFTYYNGGQTLPSKWTKAWVDNNWPANKIFSLDTNRDGVMDTYLLSNDLRGDAGAQIEAKYDVLYSYTAIHGADGSVNPTTPSQINPVAQKHIYNTAIVTPYGTSPEVLENWSGISRVINGAFIQLPQSLSGVQLRLSVPSGAAYGRVYSPSNTFQYETRFGRGSSPADTPAVGLIFAAESSWRETNSADF